MKRWLKRIRYELHQRGRRWLRAFLRAWPAAVLERVADAALRFRIVAQEARRQRSARRSPDIVPEIRSCDGRQTLARSILDPQAPWTRIPVPHCPIPGMLTAAERRYYSYITPFYSGAGQVVELGPWLGLSTHYLLTGLLANPAFNGKTIQVYDDFTWRSSWMNKWLAGTDIQPPGNHESFLPIFRDQMQAHLDRLEIHRCKVADHDGNEALPPLEWSGGGIELLVVDCGRSLRVNEAWYRALSPSFIPDKTLVIMQDWQNHKRVPEVWWENTRIFTEGKEGALDLIHEVDRAGLAAFIYRNPKETL